MIMQVCSVCGEEKLVTAFPKNGRDNEGNTRYRPDCKVCYGIKRKINKKKHSKFLSNVKHRTGEVNVFTLDDWKECLIHFRGECAYCGKKQSRTVKLTKEHVVPVSKEGRTVKRNIIPACTSCNCSKGNLLLAEWYTRQRSYTIERMVRINAWLIG